MGLAVRWFVGLCVLLCPVAARSMPHFNHIVIVIQENRTPDSLFHELCRPDRSLCSRRNDAQHYDIRWSRWKNRLSPTGYTDPVAIPFGIGYDLGHTHDEFVRMCHYGSLKMRCRMDNAAEVSCTSHTQACPTLPQFAYVDNSNGEIQPYMDLARNYGWANAMFQTNQGPSFPAHLYLFGGTSAKSRHGDRTGTFMSENMVPVQPNTVAGCIASTTTKTRLIDSAGTEFAYTYPCSDHSTLSDLLEMGGYSWRYYSPSAGIIWNSPNAIKHICQPANGTCTGPDWLANVDLMSADVLKDVAKCRLQDVSWVTPGRANSDHAGRPENVGGPSWVASIVNAIGSSRCRDRGVSYWNGTAILILWDDWGGWYDHVSAVFHHNPFGGYEMGFRVPMIVVSTFTPARTIATSRYDFGSILRFVEQNFGLSEGALGFADARSSTDLSEFFPARTPRAFVSIRAKKTVAWFLSHRYDADQRGDPDDM